MLGGMRKRITLAMHTDYQELLRGVAAKEDKSQGELLEGLLAQSYPGRVSTPPGLRQRPGPKPRLATVER